MLDYTNATFICFFGAFPEHILHLDGKVYPANDTLSEIVFTKSELNVL